MPSEPDTARSLAIVEEYLRAAQLFEELGDVQAEADARDNAGHVLTDLAWLHPEYKEPSLALLIDAERLFRQVENWQRVGTTLLGQAHLRNMSHPGFERDDARVDALMVKAVQAFQKAERPDLVADTLLIRARLVGLHSEFTEQFVDLCCAAFEAYEAGRASRLLATDREYEDQRVSYSVSFLGSAVWDHLRANPTYPRRADLVWGLEQLVKGRSFQDQQLAPTVWQRFLNSDVQLRAITEHLEQAQAELESALRGGHGESADAAQSTVELARRLQRERLKDIAAGSSIELGLTSVPVVDRQTVRKSMVPGEMYVGLVMCSGGRFLRTQLTLTDERFDAIEAPELLGLLISQRNGQQLDPADLALLHRRAYALLGLPDSGVDTLVICPNRHLVAIPWHLLDAEDGRLPLGDRMAIGVVPAAGVCTRWTRSSGAAPGITSGVPSYLGVSDKSKGLLYVDFEIENVRDNYFPNSGRCLTTGRSHELLAARGHVNLLHIASHALATGLQFTHRTITAIDLADMELTADVLLLTGCYLGAFGDDESNEFLGVVRQLLISTGAHTAVVSLAPVPDRAGPLFSELLVSAMTGHAENRPWTAPAPMAVGDAVRWVRLQMRTLTQTDARRLRRGRASTIAPSAEADPLDALHPSWWDSWFIVGDPTAWLARRPTQLKTTDDETEATMQAHLGKDHLAAVTLDAQSRDDALDVLHESLDLELTDEQWTTVRRTLDTVAEVLRSGDTEEFARAVHSLDEFGAKARRATDFGAEPKVPAPAPVRDQFNVLIHEISKPADAQE